ncbi:hypothetical protein EV182_004553, partial [Spiromyces aspiralis]
MATMGYSGCVLEEKRADHGGVGVGKLCQVEAGNEVGDGLLVSQAWRKGCVGVCPGEEDLVALFRGEAGRRGDLADAGLGGRREEQCLRDAGLGPEDSLVARRIGEEDFDLPAVSGVDCPANDLEASLGQSGTV